MEKTSNQHVYQIEKSNTIYAFLEYKEAAFDITLHEAIKKATTQYLLSMK